MNQICVYYLGQCSGQDIDVIMVDSDEECIERYAAETTRDNKISLILLDYKLGGMLGDSVARKINECNETKIILNSAYDVNGVLIKESENGNCISKYIQKPFDTDRSTDLVAGDRIKIIAIGIGR